MSPELERPLPNRSEAEAMTEYIKSRVDDMANNGRIEDLEEIGGYIKALLKMKQRGPSVRYSCESDGIAE